MVIRVPEQRNTLGGYAVLDDRLLVLDFQAGNPQAFVEIHHRYGPLARRVCGRFLPTPQDVDEAFQETMIRVYQGLYRFNGRYALQPWVARIAKNVSLDILRGRARRPKDDAWASPTEDLAGPDDEAEQIVERLVQHDTVLAVLSDLPETHRRALMMRELDGRSHREIAQEMEVSTGAGEGADPSREVELPQAVAREGGRTGWLHGDRSPTARLAPSDRGWLASGRRPSRPLGTGGAGRGTGGGQLDGGNGGGAGRVERSGRACGRGGDDVALSRWRDRWCGQDRRG